LLTPLTKRETADDSGGCAVPHPTLFVADGDVRRCVRADASFTSKLSLLIVSSMMPEKGLKLLF
jgi:hypothetical protein